MNAKSKTKKRPIRASKLGFTEADWNFQSVPNNELVVCCFWEYARESTFIRSVRKRSRQAVELGLDMKDRNEWVGADFRNIRAAIGRNAHMFQEGIYGLGGTTGYEEAVSPFPRSWQTLAEEMRHILLETAEWTPKMLLDFPAFRWSRFVRASWLAERLCRSHPHPKDSKFPLEPNIRMQRGGA